MIGYCSPFVGRFDPRLESTASIWNDFSLIFITSLFYSVRQHDVISPSHRPSQKLSTNSKSFHLLLFRSPVPTLPLPSVLSSTCEGYYILVKSEKVQCNVYIGQAAHSRGQGKYGTSASVYKILDLAGDRKFLAFEGSSVLISIRQWHWWSEHRRKPFLLDLSLQLHIFRYKNVSSRLVSFACVQSESYPLVIDWWWLLLMDDISVRHLCVNSRMHWYFFSAYYGRFCQRRVCRIVISHNSAKAHVFSVS